MKSTARMTNQLSGLVHKTNELMGSKSEYHKRFDMINYEQSERYKQQKKIKEQLARQIQGDNFLDDEDNKFFYDNEYNLPEDVIDYVIKFFDLKDNKPKKQYLDEWTKFYNSRWDFDKSCLKKLIFEIYDKRKLEQEKIALHIKPIQWIDEVEQAAEKLYELKVHELDYVIDQNIEFESVTSLPLLTWEEQLVQVKDVYLDQMESVIHDRLDENEVQLDNLQDMILELDEQYSFTEELANARNIHKKALVEYNDSYNYNKYNKLKQKIKLLNSLDSFDSRQSKNKIQLEEQEINDQDHLDFGYVIKKLESEDKQKNQSQSKNEKEKKDIEGYLQKLYERELTIQDVQDALGITEEQLKQMYILYQKAKHFDRMQIKMQKMIEQMEKQREEFERQQIQYQHMNPKNLYGNDEYLVQGQGALEFTNKTMKPHHPQSQDIVNSLPLLQQNLISSAFPIQYGQQSQVSKSQSYMVAHQSDQQQQEYGAINEGLFKGLMRELQIKCQIYHNNGRIQEVRQVQSRINKLQELYHSTNNMIILNYMLKQFREELDV